MKSVYLRILVWFAATLIVSVPAFSMVSRFVQSRAVGKGGPFARFDSLLLDEAARIYEAGGSPALAAYMQNVDNHLGRQRYITDAAGRDLVTGADRSGLLARVHYRWATPVSDGDQMLVAVSSADGRYRLIAAIDPPFSHWALLPYYLPIFGAVALICWALAFTIASPLRDLAHSVERFGRGELSVRLNSKRRDEIGELARAFDRMAARIGTLLTAERRLLQDVSHELRSPLARMSFAAELARREEHRDSAIQRMKGEINRLSALVASLVEVTRSEGDPLSRTHETIGLAELLRDIAEDCRIEADARECAISLAIADESDTLGDRELLRRAFENILRNAIRYAPPGSTVDVGLRSGARVACVTVRDYGAGVPEELLGKLGQPFFRVDDSRDSSTGGLGLGLAIARRAISVHDGEVRIESARPGLLVSVELPIAQPQAAAVAPAMNGTSAV